MQAPALRQWLRDDIARLEAAGIVLTQAEVVWLAELEKACRTPPGREIISCRAAPLHFAGVTFWPFHNRARYWFAEWSDVFEGDKELHAGLYFFAHVHSKPGDKTVIELSSADVVESAVRDWLRNQDFSLQDYQRIADKLYEMDHPDADNVPPPKTAAPDDEPRTCQTIESRCAVLCDMFQGTTPEYWMTEVSAVEAQFMAAAVASTQDVSGSSTWATSPERVQRMANYMNAVKWIALRARG